MSKGTTYCKNGAIWQPANKIWYKNGANWQETVRVWTKSAGVWEKAHPNWLLVNFQIYGAPGGFQTGKIPGLGGSVTYSAKILRGKTIEIYTAEQGSDAADYRGGGGGGASAISVDGTLLAIAGGGGGAAQYAGGDAGYVGANGSPSHGGKGGTQIAPGASGGYGSTAGNGHNGGNGGSEDGNPVTILGGWGYGIGGGGKYDSADGGGGGGGGGYFGGGGGGGPWNEDSNDRGGGGGGGSNWVNTSSYTGISFISGNSNNPLGLRGINLNGTIIISYQVSSYETVTLTYDYSGTPGTSTGNIQYHTLP